MKDVQLLLTAMNQAIAAHQPLPAMPENLSLDQAYALQQQLCQRRNGEGVSGLKAGLTGAAVQRHFALSEAVIGSLYSDGALASGTSIEAVDGLVFECEIGVVIDATGQAAFLMPVVELAFLQFSNSADLNAANIVAANVGADRYICGERRRWQPDLASTAICARQNGEIVLESTIEESLGGVVSGSAWVVQQAQQRGFAVEAGMLLILGTCGAPVAVNKGQVTVDYGVLGSVNFGIH